MAVSTRTPVQPDAPEAQPRGGQPGNAIEARNPYSPEVLGDAHVIDEHRRTAQAMELSCRQTGQLCAEAEQARKYLLARDGEGKR